MASSTLKLQMKIDSDAKFETRFKRFTKQGQVKSSQYSPQSKEQNPQQAEQGHAQIQKCV